MGGSLQQLNTELAFQFVDAARSSRGRDEQQRRRAREAFLRGDGDEAPECLQVEFDWAQPGDFAQGRSSYCAWPDGIAVLTSTPPSIMAWIAG